MNSFDKTTQSYIHKYFSWTIPKRWIDLIAINPMPSRLMKFSIDDPEQDKKIIIHNFMKELCRRDDEDNKGLSTNRNRNLNVFPVEEIQQKVLGAFEIGYIKDILRGYILENRDNEPLEFLDSELNVRLTNAGRARCNEYGL